MEFGIAPEGIDTLSAAVGDFGWPHHSSGGAALVPDRERLGPELLEKPTGKKMTLDVEGVGSGGSDSQEALR
jgi:hypothetical protein